MTSEIKHRNFIDQRVNVLGVDVNVISIDQVLCAIFYWCYLRESHYICLCNVHSVITAQSDTIFSKSINESDIALSDGAPIAWFVKYSSHSAQNRIGGPDLMWRVFNVLNADQGVSSCYNALFVEKNPAPTIFLYGSTAETLSTLADKIHDTFENVIIAGTYSPPYRDLTENEENKVIKLINQSGAGIIWIGLGCPKQEKWMMKNKGRISGVMIGVGAAFDFHAGNIRRAPIIMQKFGFEWLYRLFLEPRRLWRRYLMTNSSFVYQVFKLLIKKILFIRRK